MAKVLYITANPKPVKESRSLSMGKAFLEAYKQAKPQDEITEIDLYKIELPFIDEYILNSWNKLMGGVSFEELTIDEQQKLAQLNELTDQFIDADKYIFVTPMWNLSIPPKMKAYIDTICVAGKTFKYTEQGPVGLMQGKKAIHLQARGGVYSSGPATDFEQGDKYIRSILAFLGVAVADSVIAEGMDFMPDQAENILAKAVEQAREAAKAF